MVDFNGIFFDFQSLVANGAQFGRQSKQRRYRLIKDPKDIYLAELIRQVDGPIAMLPCVSLNYYASCEECDEENCQIKNVFEQVSDKTLKVLTTTSIDSMRSKI